jgi:hypothetical protein
MHRMPTRSEEQSRSTPHIFKLILLIPGSSSGVGYPEVYRGFCQSPRVKAGILSPTAIPPRDVP